MKGAFVGCGLLKGVFGWMDVVGTGGSVAQRYVISTGGGAFAAVVERALYFRSSERPCSDSLSIDLHWLKTSNSKCNGEIQGSLHYATDDKIVRCFGRDDVRWWLAEL
jgi:hypothetical protein